jgi:hypothetical protein
MLLIDNFYDISYVENVIKSNDITFWEKQYWTAKYILRTKQLL